jgi:HEAT repeat protein
LALLERLDRPDRQSKVLALRALGFVDDAAGTVFQRLIPLLNDPTLRLDAASALGGIGPAARAAISPLLEGLKDPDPAFRARAAETIGRIGWERQAAQYSSRTVARGAVAPLAAALKDPSAQVRAAAARALADIGSESAVAFPDLVVVLGDPVAEVRLAAVRTFGRIGAIPAGSRPSRPSGRLASRLGQRSPNLSGSSATTKTRASDGSPRERLLVWGRERRQPSPHFETPCGPRTSPRADP